MNKKEELKAHIIKCCVEGNMTVKQAANRLGFSERYIKKLKARYKKYGVSSMLHGNCGRQPKRTLDIALKQKILDIRKQPEFDTVNVMHFKDILEEKYKIIVSYSFLYNFLKENNIKSPRKHRKTKLHHRRNRRSKIGELLQIDATPHEFFIGDNNKYTLHGLIDDASGQITGLYMCKNECMQGYFEVIRQTLKNFGVPENIYADGSSIFFTTKKDKLTLEEQLSGIEEPNTQFNLFLKEYIKKYNKKFKVKPRDKKKAFIPLLKSVNLDILLTVKYKRTVDNGACFSLNNVSFKIEKIDILPRTRIDVLISKKIGIKVLYKNKLYTVIPIYDKNDIPIEKIESIENIIAEFIYFNCLKNERIA